MGKVIVDAPIDGRVRPSVIARDGVMQRNKADREPVLIQNNYGRYAFAPREVANRLVAKHEAVEMLPTDPDFVKGTKLAVGVWEGFKPGETIKIEGKAVRPEEIGKLDTAAIIKAAEESVKATHGKDGDIVVTDRMPPAPDSFGGKERERFRSR